LTLSATKAKNKLKCCPGDGQPGNLDCSIAARPSATMPMLPVVANNAHDAPFLPSCQRLSGSLVAGYPGRTGWSLELAMRTSSVLCIACLCIACLLAGCVSSGMAQTDPGHDGSHAWYKTLRSPEGESCCNEKDCHPVDARFVEHGTVGSWVLEIRIGDRWVMVPRDRILPQPSPDGGVHACFSDPAPFMTETEPGLIIRCVVLGGFS
jgi:hypothetical protein